MDLIWLVRVSMGLSQWIDSAWPDEDPAVDRAGDLVKMGVGAYAYPLPFGRVDG